MRVKNKVQKINLLKKISNGTQISVFDSSLVNDGVCGPGHTSQMFGQGNTLVLIETNENGDGLPFVGGVMMRPTMTRLTVQVFEAECEGFPPV